jgi:hypothetical protein
MRKKAKSKKINIFRELKQALEEAIAFRKGHRTDLRVTELPAPPANSS